MGLFRDRSFQALLKHVAHLLCQMPARAQRPPCTASTCGARLIGAASVKKRRSFPLAGTRRSLRRVAAGVAAFAFAAIAPARAETLTLLYGGEAYRVVALGEAFLSVRLSAGAYSAEGQIRSAGLAALFADTDLTARASGRRQNQDVRPEIYDLDHSYAGLTRKIQVRKEAGSVIVRAQPSFGFEGDPAPSELQKSVGRDPLSSMISMGLGVAATRACPPSQRIFDGRYVYDVSFDRARSGHVSGHVYHGPVLSCQIRQTRIAGYRTRSDLRKRLPDGEITFALDAHPHFAPPYKVAAATPLGRATIRLRRIIRAP